MTRLLVLVLMLLPAALACEPEFEPAPPTREATRPAGSRADPSPLPGVVLPACRWAWPERVTDGDTIRVVIDGVSEPVRLIGIDTPELNGVVEPYAEEARARLAELVAGGVCLERDVSERDRFQRRLFWVWLPDGRLVNEVLVREGLATVVTFAPDVKYHESRLWPAEGAAQREGTGIWRESE